MKFTTRPLAGHLLFKLFCLVAVLAIAACSSQPPAVPTPAASATKAPVTAQAASTPFVLPTATTAGQAASPTSAATAASPTCNAPASLTMAVTEGPFFKANSPERASLLDAGMAGTQLTLTGTVLTADCKPVADALLDFWQANAQGQYDNAGYTLRGHQFTDANGRYQLVTVDPGLYPGRTEHIHVKIQAPNGPILTTQLFFPGVADNQSDSIFDPSLLVNVQGSGASMQATFNFIISLK